MRTASRQTKKSTRGIVLSGTAPRLVITGEKTQTRRLINLPILSDSDGSKRRVFVLPKDLVEVNEAIADRKNRGFTRRVASPFWPGQRLWVRETFALCGYFDTVRLSEMKADWAAHQVKQGLLWYRADGEQPLPERPKVFEKMNGRGRWRSPRFMPQWASRIILEVTDVRVERLQDISYDDARAEGVETDEFLQRLDEAQSIAVGDCGPIFYPNVKSEFERLWDRINRKRSPWISNPWVWAVSFRLASVR